MNGWLQRTALKWQRNGGCRVVVLVDARNQVVAYYALSTGQVRRTLAPKNITRNTPDPLPVVLMGRLAVAKTWQGKGVARDLMLDAFDRVLAVSQTVGVVALVVHALEPGVVPFYARFGFQAAPSDPLTLFKRVKDIAAEV